METTKEERLKNLTKHNLSLVNALEKSRVENKLFKIQHSTDKKVIEELLVQSYNWKESINKTMIK